MSETVEISVFELEGAALDYAVYCAEYKLVPSSDNACTFLYVHPCRPHYSTDWSDGGPLIEKYKLDVGAPMENVPGPWNANTEYGHPMGTPGPTPLIATCRAIVRAKFGETFNLPNDFPPNLFD